VPNSSRPALDRTGASTKVERRGNVRHKTHAVFTARINASHLLGGGRDISRGGAYFVTSDEIPVELTFSVKDKETGVTGRIVRIESIHPGTWGIAVEFDSRIPESQLPL